MSAILEFLHAGREGDLLPWAVQRAVAEKCGVSIADVELVALEGGLLPARYQRNRSMISVKDQLRLFSTTVAVIGCGGLGGYILEGIARLGVGKIIAIDPDIFVEHNVNRQLLSSPDDFGMPKVDAAVERISRINPAVTVTPVRAAFDAENGSALIASANIAADALDNVEARFALQAVCRSLAIPFIHGAIAGWYGHVSTVFPGDEMLNRIYAHHHGGSPAEKDLGNPSFTPALVANLQVSEICKVILRQGTPLRNRMLSIDLREMDFEQIPLHPSQKRSETYGPDRPPRTEDQLPSVVGD